MAATPPSQSNPAGDDRNLVEINEATAVTFEDKLQLFWKNNSKAVIGLIVVVLLAIAGFEGWKYVERQKDNDVKAAYAAATTPDQKKAFIASHPNHVLSGIAYLNIADDAYKAGKAADAAAAYDQAISVLKTGPLAARAQLGRAVAKAQAGKTAEATTELKQLVDDKNQSKAIRAEAAYDLTSFAVEAGNAADAQKYSEQVMAIDPTSPFTQRALAARASLPEKPAEAAAPAPGEKAGSDVKLSIPGKK